jgi:hypothetical protein
LQTIALIAALWLTLAAAYFIWPVLRARLSPPKRRGVRVLKEISFVPEVPLSYNDRVASATAAIERPLPRRVALPFPIAPGETGSPTRALEPAAPSFLAQVASTSQGVTPADHEAQVPAAPSTEVAYLRAQVQQLRHELVSLGAPAANDRYERPRLQRYRTGAYTYLPRDLRRHVHDVRSGRRAPRFS